MSRRARMMLALVAVAAVGLVIVDAVFYLELRSYLYEQVDQQVSSAVAPVSRTLAFAPDASRHLPALPGRPPVGGSIPFPGGPPPGGPPPEELHIPPGTYGVIVSGRKVVKRAPFAYGEAGLPRPVLPQRPPISTTPDSLRTFTAPATSGSSGFRAAALRLPGSGRTLVVAVPLGDANNTLAHVRLIGLIVSGVVLAALAALAWWVIRVGQIQGELAAREESERRMRRFLTDASHELRTPLASIRGYSELFRLGADADPDDLRTAMRRIEDESSRMGVLVDELLTLARLDEVREPVRERVNLAELAADAAADARASAPDRTIKLDIADAERCTEISGDPGQLRQLAGNLLANALAHTPAGTPVEITVWGGAEDVGITVRDHGPGLPEGAADQVFERFWSARREPGAEGTGSGLGLAIVAGVAEAHGGRTEAAEAAGGGAAFTVTLPRQVAAPA